MAQAPLESFLVWARSTIGDDKLVEALAATIRRRASAADMTVDDYLDSLGARLMYREAVRLNGDRKFVSGHEAKLIRFLKVFGLSLEIDFPHRPWDRWRSCRPLVIVYGERLVSIPEMSSAVSQRAVGARDAEAITYITEHLRRNARIDYVVELVPIPYDMSDADAQLKMEKLLDKYKHAGAIVVLGSPVVNRLAEPWAKRITGDDPDLLPGKFQWSFPDEISFLSDYGIDRKHEGILARRDALSPKLYPRVHDDEVEGLLEQGRTLFRDCGMLLMDCREMPYKILCAGHGGLGTISCAKAFVEELDEIAARLHENRNRVFEIIKARRRKKQPDKTSVDDMELEDWEFATVSKPYIPAVDIRIV